MAADSTDRLWRLYVGSALLGAALCLVLFALRAASSISVVEPLQLHTTGDEFTNYFNIWKAMNGQAVYSDRFQAPFSVAVYNWLFYYAYATVARGVLAVLGLSDAWLPTVGRFITLAAIATGTVVAYVAFARAALARDATGKAVAAAFAVFLMVGPLLGFWSLTVRADLWAMTLEMAGAAAFLVLYPRRRFVAVLILAVAVYAAWSFKQGNVFAAGGAGILLVLRRDWKPLALLCLVLPVAWAATFAWGDAGWIDNILFRDFPLFFQAERLARNMANFAVKTGPLLLFLPAVAWAAGRSAECRRRLWNDDTFVFAAGASVTALTLSIPLAAQHGGGENYFFTLAFFLGLMAMSSFPILADDGPATRRIPLIAGIAGWLTLYAAVGAVLSGAIGTIDVRRQHPVYMSMKRCADSLPRPLYVNNNYLGLPWMTPGNTPWVLSYTYKEERALARRPFQGGGIGGMVNAGAFAVIAYQSDEKEPPTELDGGILAMRYERRAGPQCPRTFVFFRKNP